ncbi:hypothetical protein [Hymenobacter sp. YC55]|uniref:hypothetical protein n=1 Tax=Hymenobacter sp. YC55 TaxID=3034019 RepID=UPI0023F9BF18|nr:hypothetical protein [Hymenobacter sp. YC55]MDF7809933.1 hypothetical protein [Hymenobacter sp. YC55]
MDNLQHLLSGLNEWFWVWAVVVVFSHRKSSLRTIAVLGMIYCLLVSCTPRGYSFAEARLVQRHHDHRVAVNKRHSRRTHSKVMANARQQQKQRLKEQQQRQQQLSRLDAVSHQK